MEESLSRAEESRGGQLGWARGIRNEGAIPGAHQNGVGESTPDKG